MRKFLIVLSVLVAVALLPGCRSKKELVLFGPGDTKAWQTVDTKQQQAYVDSLKRVEIMTSEGRIVVELYEDKAPVSVANFLQYVSDGFYDNTVFHRVEPGMVIQGGGFTPDLNRKTTGDPITNEAGNGLKNNRGTLGMARTAEMGSATSQFFINLVDNNYFNGNGIDGGYAVFGRIYEGMNIVDKIASKPTTRVGGMSNVPIDPVIILSARQLK